LPYSLERWLAGRWIAGPGIDDALERAKQMNKKGISAIVNYLGEDLARKMDVDEAVETYIALITRMSKQRIRGDISLKPTQIGLSIGRRLMEENYVKIMEHAKMHGVFVWLDMEEPKDVGRVIDAYLQVNKRLRGGICIQAYLKRSTEDAERITRNNGTIRLVKGAYGYREGSGMIDGRGGIDENYRGIMRYLFGHSEKFMIATHDRTLLAEAMALNREAHRKVTYAMLNGIDNGYAKMMAAQKENVALYLPFGTRWVGYSYRRVREMGHMRLILQSLFRSQQL